MNRRIKIEYDPTRWESDCVLEPIITPAIKHVNKFFGMPVFPENRGHALIYLVAGVVKLLLLHIGKKDIFHEFVKNPNDPKKLRG